MFVFGELGTDRSGPTVAARRGGTSEPSLIIVACEAAPGIEGGAISGSSAAMPMRVFCSCAAYAMIVFASTLASPGASERAGEIGGDLWR